jgi:hypothetical protein
MVFQVNNHFDHLRRKLLPLQRHPVPPFEKEKNSFSKGFISYFF